MGKIAGLIGDERLIMIDTCCFIYHIESKHYPAFASAMSELFDLVSQGRIKALTSPITITEIMTRPRRLGLEDVAYAYKMLLTNFPNLIIPSIDLAIADKAAALRGAYGFKPPDALQLATGIIYHAGAFITFDREFIKAASLVRIILPE